jgi:hypothetical protein
MENEKGPEMIKPNLKQSFRFGYDDYFQNRTSI